MGINKLNYQMREVVYDDACCDETQYHKQWEKPILKRVGREELEHVFGSLINPGKIIKISNQI